MCILNTDAKCDLTLCNSTTPAGHTRKCTKNTFMAFESITLLACNHNEYSLVHSH